MPKTTILQKYRTKLNNIEKGPRTLAVRKSSAPDIGKILKKMQFPWRPASVPATVAEAAGEIIEHCTDSPAAVNERAALTLFHDQLREEDQPRRSRESAKFVRWRVLEGAAKPTKPAPSTTAKLTDQPPRAQRNRTRGKGSSQKHSQIWRLTNEKNKLETRLRKLAAELAEPNASAPA